MSIESPDGPTDETRDSSAPGAGGRARLRRRAVVGAAVWSVPVITVVSAAPALAASGANTLTRTSPATDFSADQLSTAQQLAVTLTDSSGVGVSGSMIAFSSTDTSGFITFANGGVAVTGTGGLATIALEYATPVPAPGSTFTVLAAQQDNPAVSTMWTVTYTPLPNLMVVRVGDGSAALGKTATAVFVEEYAVTGGSRVDSLALPTTITGANKRLTLSGSATSEGALALSPDRKYLTLAGYDAPLATAAVASTASTATNRVVARIDHSQSIDTTTALTDASTGNNMRSAVTSNGADIWTAGGAGGTRYTTVSATTSTQITTATNVRVVEIAGGQLYFSTGSGTAGVYAVGSGLPTTATQTATLIAAAASPYAFVLLDLSPDVAGLDTLYVADDTVGIRKFSLVGGTWTANGTVALGSVYALGLTGTVTADGNVTLFATTTTTSANALVRVVDTAGYNATVTATVSPTATAGTNTAFRGVAFAPSAG